MKIYKRCAVLLLICLLTANVFAQPAPTITQGFVTMNFEWDWTLQQTVQPPPSVFYMYGYWNNTGAIQYFIEASTNNFVTVWSPGNNGPGIGAFSQNSTFAYYLIPFHPAVQTRLRSY